MKESVINDITLTEGELSFYRDYGYLLLPQLINKNFVERIREEVLDVCAANGSSRESLAQASSSSDKLHQSSQYLESQALNTLINGEKILSIAGQLVGGTAKVYLPFTAVKAGGGGGKFDYHQDNQYTRHEPAEYSINIWVALVDMTPENGCLQVAPRTHLGGTLDSRESDDHDGHRAMDLDENEFLPVRMHAGDAIAFTRLTVHGSGANNTQEPRVAYALQFHRDDVKWFDRRTEEWKRLTDSQRFQVRPVETLG